MVRVFVLGAYIDDRFRGGFSRLVLDLAGLCGEENLGYIHFLVCLSSVRVDEGIGGSDTNRD